MQTPGPSEEAGHDNTSGEGSQQAHSPSANHVNGGGSGPQEPSPPPTPGANPLVGGGAPPSPPPAPSPGVIMSNSVLSGGNSNDVVAAINRVAGSYESGHRYADKTPLPMVKGELLADFIEKELPFIDSISKYEPKQRLALLECAIRKPAEENTRAKHILSANTSLGSVYSFTNNSMMNKFAYHDQPTFFFSQLRSEFNMQSV